MPGYDRSRIVGVSEEDLEEFTCVICLEVLNKPTVTQCCGQTFCFDCINEWLRENNTCSNDRKRLTTDQLKSSPKMVNNLLSNMKIKCDFHERGCNVVIKISELDKHKQNCHLNPLRKCNNCGQNKLNHTDKDCVRSLIEKLNSLQKEYDQFRQKKESEHKRLKKDYDEFQEKQEIEMGEALFKFRNLENNFNMTERLKDNIMKKNIELQNKISRLEENKKNLLEHDFTGKFKQIKSENFDEFLKELGMSLTLRESAKSSVTTLEITKFGDTYKLKTMSAIENTATNFKLGKEFTVGVLMEGQIIKSVITAEGNKLVHKSHHGFKEAVKIVREFNGNELKETSYIGNVVAVKVYNKL